MSDSNNPRTSAPGGDGPKGDADQSDTNNATAVLDDLEALRERAATMEKERDEFKSLLQRTRADFENYQKRSQRDAAQERRYSHAGLALDVLPILDNFDRAVDA